MRAGVMVLLFLSWGSSLPGSDLHLKNRLVETGTITGMASTAMPKRWRQDSSHFLVQFKTEVSSDILSELARRGAVVTAAIPDRAVMVAAPDQFTTFGMDVEFVGRLLPIDKMSDQLAATGPITAVVEFHADVDSTTAREILLHSSLRIVSDSGLAANHFLVHGTLAQLHALAAYDEVAYVFPADPEFTTGVTLTACAGALTQGGTVPQYALIGHGWSASATGEVDLTYVFGKLTSKLAADQLKAEIERAFGEWAKHAPLHFAEGSQEHGPRTIDILFASGAHGDPFAFDGAGGILAHTFYPAPPNPEPIAGDMHFDEDEAWHIGTSTDVFTVALHEAGHALGLGHSDDPNSVMYPYYRYGKQLSASDIAGIQALYGSQLTSGTVTTPAPTTTTSSKPPSAPAPAAPALPMLVSIDTPSSAAVTATSGQINVSGHVVNAAGAVTVTWQTDHGATGAASGTSAWTAAAIPLPAGQTTITITATDMSHRTATHSLQVTRQGAPLTTAAAPTLAIIAPSLSIVATTASQITLKGTAASTVGIVAVSWQALGGRTGNATGTSNWSAVVPLYTGTNPISVTATDTAGNSRTITLTVVRQ